MRILFVNQFFHPDLAATAQIVSDLAADLSERGAEVTVITGRGAYTGDARYSPREIWRGIDIRRVPSTNLGRGSVAKRIADYGTFFASCTAELARLPAQDLVITLSTPPLISLLGAGKKYGSLTKTRFIYWVQDLYPDVAVQFGLLGKHSPATLALDAASKASLRAADAVVALGDSMAERLRQKGVDDARLNVIHNWSDEVIGSVKPEDNWFLDKHGLRGKFVVLYSGNMGRGHEFATLLAAAERLGHRDDIVFLFIGDGGKRKEVEDFARTHPNVRLLPYQKREDLPFSLGSGNVFAVTLSDGLEGMIVPSKLYGALAAGKPVLYVGPKASEVGQILRDERCGGVFEHGDAAGVAGFIERLAGDAAESKDMGARGRAAFLAKYERRIGTAAFAALCERVVSGGSPAPRPAAPVEVQT